MNDDEKLKDIFETKKVSKFDKLIFKAKVFSIIRGTVISVVVVVVLGCILLINNTITLNRLGDDKKTVMEHLYNISGPNSYIGATQFDDRIMIGEFSYTKYKFVGSKVVTDGDYKESYGYMPLINGIYGHMGDSLFEGEVETESGHALNENQTYNKIGRKMMKFYIPSIKYKYYTNDLPTLSKIGEDKNAEISLSFDKAYSIDEVKNMMPKNITLNWFWVDSYDKKQINDMSTSVNMVENEEDVYGIKSLQDNGDKIKNPEGSFIQTICTAKSIKGTDSQTYQTLFNNLSKDKKTIKKADIKIIGVVVSGDVNSLKQLQGKSFIKASTFGAIVDKY